MVNRSASNGDVGLISILIFIVVLSLGLAYAWKEFEMDVNKVKISAPSEDFKDNETLQAYIMS